MAYAVLDTPTTIRYAHDKQSPSPQEAAGRGLLWLTAHESAALTTRAALVFALRMTLEWEQVLVHSVDPVALGQRWAEALGWVVVHSSDDEFEIRPAPDRLPGLDFVRVDEARTAKSRLHLDFRPDDQAAEVARLVAHGARHVDIGQGAQSWVVLADPEGNEFCVLGRRRQ